MAKAPKVSVLMSVYNTPEAYLKEAIESILNQSFQDFEFLILDDGSKANVAAVVKSYTDKRIRYVYHQNEGVSRTRNWGLDLAKGEYIACMDSDDISLPERFAEQLAYFKANPDVSLVGSWFEAFPQNHVIKPTEQTDYLGLLRQNNFGHSTVMWRKADFEKYGLRYNPDFSSAVDYELWSRAVRHVKMCNIQKVLVKWRMHEWQITQTQNKKQTENAKRVQKTMLDFLSTDKEMVKNICELIKQNQKCWLPRLQVVLPLIKIKKKRGIKKCFLFGIIPILKKVTKEEI